MKCSKHTHTHTYTQGTKSNRKAKPRAPASETAKCDAGRQGKLLGGGWWFGSKRMPSLEKSNSPQWSVQRLPCKNSLWGLAPTRLHRVAGTRRCGFEAGVREDRLNPNPLLHQQGPLRGTTGGAGEAPLQEDSSRNRRARAVPGSCCTPLGTPAARARPPSECQCGVRWVRAERERRKSVSQSVSRSVRLGGETGRRKPTTLPAREAGQAGSDRACGVL